MRTPTIAVIAFVLMAALGPAVRAAAEVEPPPLPHELTGTFERVLFDPPGKRTINVAIKVDNLLTEREALGLRNTLASQGEAGLLAALQGRQTGRLVLGAVEFPLGAIGMRRYNDVWRYVIVTARPINLEEQYQGKESANFPFGAAIFTVDDSGRGEGEVYPACTLAIEPDGSVMIEHYGPTPSRLLDIRLKR